MNKPLLLVCAALLLSATSLAQSQSASPELMQMLSAAQVRKDLATAIIKGEQKTTGAVATLKSQKSASGSNVGAQLDFGLAALDVGQQLHANGRLAEAWTFFAEAEKALDVALKAASEKAVGERVMCLRHLALLRANYLNKPAQALADLDEALGLLPDNAELKRAQKLIARSNGESVKNTPPTK